MFSQGLNAAGGQLTQGLNANGEPVPLSAPAYVPRLAGVSGGGGGGWSGGGGAGGLFVITDERTGLDTQEHILQLAFRWLNQAHERERSLEQELAAARKSERPDPLPHLLDYFVSLRENEKDRRHHRRPRIIRPLNVYQVYPPLPRRPVPWAEIGGAVGLFLLSYATGYFIARAIDRHRRPV